MVHIHTRIGIAKGQDATHTVDLTAGVLTPPDSKELEDELKLVELAIAQGEVEQPASDRKVRISEESQIDQRIEKWLKKCYEHVSANIQNLDASARTDRDDVLRKIDDVRLMADQFKQDARVALSQDRLEYDANKKRYLEAKDAYETFRKDNRLRRPAKVPTGARKTLSWLILISLILLEATLNAGLFATNNASGLLGGLLIAVLAAALNATFAFFVARTLIRQIIHVKVHRKILGLIGLALLAVGVVTIAFGVGHYRDAMQIISEQPTEQLALYTLTHTPFDLADLFSWLLFGVTILSACFAAFDGFFYVDPYPGYTDEEEHYRRANDDWDAYTADLREELEEIKEKCLNDIDTKIAECHNGVQSMIRSMQDKENLLMSYHGARQSGQFLLTSLVGKFRDANRKVRTTPAPVYFDKWDDVILAQQSEIVCESREHDETTRNTLETEVNALRHEASSLKAEIISSFNAHCETYEL